MINTANLVGSVSRKAGGLHESVRRLVQSVAEAGVGVRVLSVEDEFTDADLAVWNPVKVDVFPRTWPDAFGYSPGFLRVLRNRLPDLIHTHGIWMYPSIATAVFCHQQRLPYMISPHGMLDPWAVRHHRWKKIIAYALFESDHVRGARCIRALCESEARAIRQMGVKNPVAIIPNGIDLPEMRSAECGVRSVPWKTLIEPGRKVLLFLSRIHPKKGLANLLRAWALVHGSRHPSPVTRHSDWVLAIAGWDQEGHEAELKQLATELGIVWADIRESKAESRKQKAETETANAEKLKTEKLKSDFSVSAFQNVSVLFLGPQFNEAKEACYRECDAFVLPSFSEGLPMVILEAWAFGKPVLMTPECNLPEGFTALAAIRIETNPENIAQGLRELLHAPHSALRTLGDNGRQLVAENFTWATIATKLKLTYEWMLGSGRDLDWMYGD